MINSLINEFDKALKVLTLPSKASRNRPDLNIKESTKITTKEKKLNAKLMRVNHSGEICAQGLYRGQLFFNKNLNIEDKLKKAALEEIDHLSWCESRIKELNGQKSLLNPIFYFSSFTIGSIASIIDEKYNLGFLSETEKQVSIHLDSHIKKISKNDLKTKTILKKMKEDEERHQADAKEMGGSDLPKPLKILMAFSSKIMTSTTFKI
jgi:ubiquinone biosynthesis monooxygenase Coq7